MRAWLTTVACVAGAMVAAPSALASSVHSSNWAGYAVHRSGVSFHEVIGSWRQPKPACQPGQQTFSSYWVGLGGYSVNSRALEQTGTEADCTRSGIIKSFAWYEVVPAPSVPIRLAVAPGDLIQAIVLGRHGWIKVILRDVTRQTQFSKALRVGVVDLSSAEWIAEAPSDCLSATRCVTLPLADFGSVMFRGARVTSAAGHDGSISDAHWSPTAIRLVPTGRGNVLNNGGLGPGGQASPSALQAGGTTFGVSYSPLAGGPRSASAAPVLPVDQLLHLGR